MPPHFSTLQADPPAQTYGDAAPPAPIPETLAAPAPEAARVADPSLPPAAKPVLALTLLSNLLRQHHQYHYTYHRLHVNGKAKGNDDGTGPGYENRVRSGFDELDDYVLMGGVERGAVVGVNGGVDDGRGVGGGGAVGQLVCLHLLTTVLLSNPLAKASVIDTTGSFPVSLLAKIIRLRAAPQLGQAGHGVEKLDIEQALDEAVEELLGRVHISRVFDIEGVWEVLSEISADCQSPILMQDPLHLAEKDAEATDCMSGQEIAVPETASLKLLGLEVEAEGEKELEIDDSEAEEEDIDFEDDLAGADTSQTDHTNAPHSSNIILPREHPTLRSKPPDTRKTDIIIIDNMTTPISELFSRRERSFAHTLLTTFSRTLHTLSQTHNILTLLLNTFTSPPPRQGLPRGSTRGSPQPSSARLPTKPISVFAATTARPALGRLFSDLCALQLLVTAVPKTAKDAELLYASPDPGGDDGLRTPLRDLPPQGREAGEAGVEYAFIVEVIKDMVGNIHSWLELELDRDPPSHHLNNARQSPSYGSRKRKRPRTQRWAPFTISPDGLTLQNAFGPATEVGKQMHIAKKFPFGRRV